MTKKTVTLRGIDDVTKMLHDIAPKEARNLMRSTIHGMAGEIRDEAKRRMPVDSGQMKAATRTRRRRITAANMKIRSDVVVTRAAYYWRFREYGQGPDMREDAMFMKAVAVFREDMHRMFVEQFGKKLEARLARLRKKLGG